jgi:acyl dehydratase
MTGIENQIEIGQSWTHDFIFTQEQVNAFANITGDNNPLHINPEYAAQTAFRKPIMHGMLGACVFSKVFGTIKPGPKSIYLSQTLKFLKPLYPDFPYRAVFSVVEQAGKRFKIRTEILDSESGEKLTDGDAWLRVR